MSRRPQAVRVRNSVPRSEREEKRDRLRALLFESLWGLLVVLSMIVAVFILLGLEPPRQ